MNMTVPFSGFATVVLALGALPILAQAQGRPMQYTLTPLDNAYVTVSRDSAPCAKAEAGKCEDRVVLAMGDIAIVSGGRKRDLKRGQVAIFKAGDSYDAPTGGPYFEVAIKPGHPPVKSPPENIPPPKNVIVHENAKYFIYEEILAVGDIRSRHTHSQRVEIRLNSGPVLHQWIWSGDKINELHPSAVNWREANIHEVRNIGDMPLRNFILEFMPQR